MLAHADEATADRSIIVTGQREGSVHAESRQATPGAITIAPRAPIEQNT